MGLRAFFTYTILETTLNLFIVVKGSVIVCIPDTHFPWVNANSLSAIYAHIEKEKPTHIVQLGDLYDCWSYTRFPRTLETELTPDEEIAEGRKMAEGMWKTIRQISKHSMHYQLLGNHDSRPEKKALQDAVELHGIVQRTMKELFTFDRVHTIHDHRQELIIDGIAFIHGYATRPGAHMNHMQGNFNVVHGHSHRAGLFHKVFGNKMRWEMDCGYIADPSAKCMSYTAQRWINWTQSFGVIRNGVPEVILL